MKGGQKGVGGGEGMVLALALWNGFHNIASQLLTGEGREGGRGGEVKGGGREGGRGRVGLGKFLQSVLTKRSVS